MTTPRHGGLGRGLGALIPQANDGDLAVAGARFAEVPVDRIAPNPSQPRSHFDAEALAELVTSIREVGLLQRVSGGCGRRRRPASSASPRSCATPATT
jgi:ParB family chromosome partitioning protein